MSCSRSDDDQNAEREEEAKGGCEGSEEGLNFKGGGENRNGKVERWRGVGGKDELSDECEKG